MTLDASLALRDAKEENAYLSSRERGGQRYAAAAASGPASRLQHRRIDNIERIAGGIGGDLIEDVGELDLVFVARDIAEMRRAYDVRHPQERVAGVAHRLVLVDVDGGHAGASGAQRGDERARRDQAGPARVHQQRRRLHALEI